MYIYIQGLRTNQVCFDEVLMYFRNFIYIYIYMSYFVDEGLELLIDDSILVFLAIY